MAFTFGGISATTQKKALSLDRTNWKIIDKYDESQPYYVFLLDRKPNALALTKLTTYLEKEGIVSYSILYCLTVMVYGDISGSIVEFMATNKSPWQTLLASRKTPKGIMTFGQSLYQITEDAILMPEHFSNAFTMCPTYFWWSKEFDGFDCRVFPVDSIDFVFMIPTEKDSFGSAITWRTRFFSEIQLRKMIDGGFMSLNFDPYKIIVIETKEEADKFFLDHMGEEEVAYDSETTGFEWVDGDYSFCWTFAFDETTGYYIDSELIDWDLMIKMLNSCKKRIGANPKYDSHFLWSDSKQPKSVYPTDAIDRLCHVINSTRPKGLKPMTWIYTSLGGYEKELERYKKQTRVKSYRSIPKSIIQKYAPLDAIATMRVFHKAWEHMVFLDKKFPNEKDPRWTMESFYRDTIMGTYNFFIDMEHDGVYVDKVKLEESQKQLVERQQNLIKKLRQIWELDDDVNIQSNEVLGKLFLEKGWEPVAKTAKGYYTTNDDSLSVWERANRPGIKELKELRGVSQCLKTFVGQTDYETGQGKTGWMKMIHHHPEDNSWRLHAKVNVGGAETFRNQMSKPNLQNITMRGEFAGYIKPCLSSPDPKKFKLMTVDASSLQMRQAAVDTFLNPGGMDKMMWELYKPGGLDDAHSATAFNIYCKSLNATILDVVDEKGNKYMFGDKQKIKIKRNNEFVVILAKELQSSDVIEPDELYNFKKDTL